MIHPITYDKGQIARLTNDLTALYISGTIRRSPSGGRGPRGLALSPDGKKVYVANIDLPFDNNEYDAPHTISVIELK